MITLPSSSSSSSSSSLSAPNGFAVDLPPKPDPVAEAKLLSFVAPLPNPPLPKPLPNPEPPRDANPEAPVLANGEAAEDDVRLKPVTAGFSVDVVVVVDLPKTDDVGVEPPKAPKGDCSELANDARPEAANAEEDVVCDLASSLSDDLEPSDAKGETAEVFRKLFGKDDYSNRSVNMVEFNVKST